MKLVFLRLPWRGVGCGEGSANAELEHAVLQFKFAGMAWRALAAAGKFEVRTIRLDLGGLQRTPNAAPLRSTGDGKCGGVMDL